VPPVGASTPPPEPEELAEPPPVVSVVAEVPPPVAGVVVAGVVVAGVVVAGVLVVSLVAVLGEPVSIEPVEPVVEVEAPELDALASSRLLLLSVGTIGTVVLGTTSAIFEPPQAATAPAHSTPPIITSERREPRVTRSRPERTHTTPAGRAVVQVALSELIAPRAEAERLDCPRQLRLRRCQRQHASDHLERLACLAVCVDAVGLDLDDQLAARRGRPQAVAITSTHQ
jgi:hypothetical protein